MRYGLLEGLLSQQCGGWILGGCGQKKKCCLPFQSTTNSDLHQVVSYCSHLMVRPEGSGSRKSEILALGS